jgi:hypothetical protein
MLLDCGHHNRAFCGGRRRSTAGPVAREVGEVTAAMVAAAPHRQIQHVCASAVVGQNNRPRSCRQRGAYVILFHAQLAV